VLRRAGRRPDDASRCLHTALACGSGSMSLAMCIALGCLSFVPPLAQPDQAGRAPPAVAAGGWVEGFAAPGLPDLIFATVSCANGDVVFGGKRFILPNEVRADGIA